MADYVFIHEHRYRLTISGTGDITAYPKDFAVDVIPKRDPDEYQIWIADVRGKYGTGLYNAGLRPRHGYLGPNGDYLDASAESHGYQQFVKFHGDDNAGYSFYITSSDSPVELVHVGGDNKLKTGKNSNTKFEITDLSANS